MPTIDADQLNRRGMGLFRCGYFRKAHDYFQAALERVDPAAQPVLYFDISYNLARALQHRGEDRKATRVFEALRVADARRSIRYEHGVAASNYRLGDYNTAIQRFARITEKYRHRKKDFFYYDSKLGAASCHTMMKEYAASLGLLRALVREDPDHSAVYLKEIERLKMGLDDELTFMAGGLHRPHSGPDARRPEASPRLEGDPRLCELLASVITKFPEIRLPVRAVFVEKRENNPPGLLRLGSPNRFVPISQSHRETSGHVLIYNKEFWSGASDSALRGNLAHELMHRAWEDSGADRVFFAWTKDTLSYGCLERVVDLCVLAKGFVEDLYNAKRYIQENSRSGDNIDLGLEELSRLLSSASRFEMAGADSNLIKFEIPESIAGEVGV